jgi:CheY-like chemotaxis protein
MLDKKRVLIVDDDHDIVQGANLRLRAAGYETLNASDGEQGVAAALTNVPDAILLDVRMPRLDGLGALAQLKQRQETKHIPVVVLSASLRDQQAALDAGARFFLTKPYRSSDLLLAVKSALAIAPSTAG